MTESDALESQEPPDLYCGLPVPSFFRADGSSLWSPPPPSGLQQYDIEIGVEYARQTIALARAIGCPNIIGFVMRDMIRQGRFTDIEAGFLGVICSSAFVGTLN